jgi:hypothetical protein
MTRAAVRSVVVSAGLLLFPGVAWAEVMDKEPTPTLLWTRALILGVIGCLAWWRHWALGVLAAAISAVVVWSFQLELMDTYVGLAIRLEAGRGYVAQAYASMFTCAALHIAGAVAFFRSRRARSAATVA